MFKPINQNNQNGEYLSDNNRTSKANDFPKVNGTYINGASNTQQNSFLAKINPNVNQGSLHNATQKGEFLVNDN